MWIIPIIFLLVPINRIEINVNRKLSITSAIDQVETALTSPYDADIMPNAKPDKIQDTIKSNINNKYSLKQICYNLLPIVWCSLYLIGTLIFIISNVNMHIQTNITLKYIDERMKNILASCKKRLKIKKRIEIRIQSFNKSPCIYGILTPKILIPKEFIEKDDKTIENIFMHELSHYKRRDMLTNYILLLALTVHWFNPIVHYFFKKIRQDMELATDEIVLNKMNKQEKKQYGMTLISLLASYQNERVIVKSLCMADDNKNMERRIKMISLSTKLKKNKKLITLLVLIILICIILPFTIKPISLAKDVINDNINILDKDSSLNDTYDNDYDVNLDRKTFSINLKNSLATKNMNVSVDPYIICGDWVPYMATLDGKEINLRDIYGSSLLDYGGSLSINENGTYSDIFGVYAEEYIDNYIGKYEILGADESYITARLTSNNEEERYIEFSIEHDILVKELWDGTLVYFTRQ